MRIDTVIFDWGGTLTPWISVDARAIWTAASRVIDPERAEELAARLLAAERALWERAKTEHRTFTLAELFTVARVCATDAALEVLRAQWEIASHTDPQVAPTIVALRDRGLRVGILSNTCWPREWHDGWLHRDGVLDLFDSAVYSCELEWTKPHPRAFLAAMSAVGAAEPRTCVYVGDRLFEDVWGPQQLGMRAVHVPHSAIPAEQIGHSTGVPDATIQELADLPDVIDAWT